MKLFTTLAKAICRLLGHDWGNVSQTERKCSRCCREEGVWMRRFPRVGEPLYEWGATPRQRYVEVIESVGEDMDA